MGGGAVGGQWAVVVDDMMGKEVAGGKLTSGFFVDNPKLEGWSDWAERRDLRHVSRPR